LSVGDQIQVDNATAPGPNRSWAAVLVAIGVLAAAVVIFVALSPDPADVDPEGSTSVAFDPVSARDVAEDWWRDVIAGNTQAAQALSHPEAVFDFSELSSESPSGESTVAVVVDSVPFGSFEEPQLCYLLLASEVEFTGSIVFRMDGDSWLPWEIRPNAQNCYVPPRPAP